ncbi:hypothetical protein [Paenibacillus marchantiophytorum]|uniref:hypothetical protein n=1 Tax=Paenibacillus marchantiophytorum TaxID=1619310 RepID=UPI00166E4242|nr:hypothetical protein [Paenibacillus marchantiophytorum]
MGEHRIELLDDHHFESSSAQCFRDHLPYRLIIFNDFRLVQLFQAEQEGEHVPKPSSITAVIAIILLVFGYWLVFQPMTTGAQMGRNLLLIFGSILVGTYLLFRFGKYDQHLPVDFPGPRGNLG